VSLVLVSLAVGMRLLGGLQVGRLEAGECAGGREGSVEGRWVGGRARGRVSGREGLKGKSGAGAGGGGLWAGQSSVVESFEPPFLDRRPRPEALSFGRAGCHTIT